MNLTRKRQINARCGGFQGSQIGHSFFLPDFKSASVSTNLPYGFLIPFMAIAPVNMLRRLLGM